jgi:DNA-binding response OmpR family regulator
VFEQESSVATKKRSLPVTAVLFGLEEELARELTNTLTDCCRQVESVDRKAVQSSRKLPQADVIFCPADVTRVRQLRDEFPRSSVIVASRLPEVGDWLDALEAGAADYCAAPFEPAQIRWVLESHVRAAVTAA